MTKEITPDDIISLCYDINTFIAEHIDKIDITIDKKLIDMIISIVDTLDKYFQDYKGHFDDIKNPAKTYKPIKVYNLLCMIRNKPTCNCECCKFITNNQQLIKDELKSVCDKLESWGKGFFTEFEKHQSGWKYGKPYEQFGVALVEMNFFHKNARNTLSGGMDNDKMKTYTIFINKYKDNKISAIVSPGSVYAHRTNLLINEAECNNGDDLARILYGYGFLPISNKIQYPDCFLTSSH